MFFDEKDIQGAYSELSRYEKAEEDERDISFGAIWAIIGSCGTLLMTLAVFAFTLM